MDIPVPRFQGVAFEADGGWKWEIIVTFLGDGDNGDSYHSKRVYETKKIAIEEMKKAIQQMIKIMSEICGVDCDQSQYIDLKTNEKRKWDRSDEQ